MNKSELVSRLTERLGGDRTIATAAVNGVLEEIEGSVARGERVSLIGFGTFDRRERAARTGRNPQTGAAIQLPASSAPVFRPGAGFRSLLSQNGASTAAKAYGRVDDVGGSGGRRAEEEGCQEDVEEDRRRGRGQGWQEGEAGGEEAREEDGEEGPLKP